MSAKEFLYKLASKVPTRKNKLLHNSDVFCIAPWIQLHAQTNGKIAPCCMSAVDDNNELGDLRQNPRLEDAWNSASAKALRLNMLNGKKSSICSHCYKYEEAGKFSERMQYNREFEKEFHRVTATTADGSAKRLDVPLIDIRFSNKCNYKCRICDSAFSSLWFDEEQKINRPRRPPTYDTKKEIKAAADEATFMQSYKNMLQGVKRLHFAGGEPLFMDEHYETLEHLIAIGRTKITLSYNTNFSTLRYKKHNVVDLWNHFEKIDVWASLDGMGEQGDYQRKGQKWEKIEENIRTVQQQCKPALFGVNITVSILNILHIPDFFTYLVQNKLTQPERINLYLLFAPDYYSIINLTPALKQKALGRFIDFENSFLTTLNASQSANIRNHVKAVTNYMMSENGSQQKEFKHWIKAVDKLREEDFISVFPELEEMIND